MDAAINALQLIQRKLEKDRVSRQQELDEALRQVETETTGQISQAQQLADEGLRSLRNALAEASRLTGEDKARLQASLNQPATQAVPGPQTMLPGGGAGNRLGAIGVQSAPPRLGATNPSSSAGVTDPMLENKRLLADGSLESMRRMIETELNQAAEINGRQLANAKQVAMAQRGVAAAKLQRKFNDVVLLGTDALLASISRILQIQNVLDVPKLAVAVAAEAATLIERYQRELEPALNSAVTQIGQQLQPVRAAVELIQYHAARATAILGKMEQAVRLQTLPARQAVAASLAGLPDSPPARAAIQIRAVGSLVAVKERAVGQLTRIKADLQRTSTMPSPSEMGTIRTRSAASLEQAFRGKSPADVQLMKTRLFDEARRQYGANPLLLASIQQAIDNAARTYGGR